MQREKSRLLISMQVLDDNPERQNSEWFAIEELRCSCVARGSEQIKTSKDCLVLAKGQGKRRRENRGIDRKKRDKRREREKKRRGRRSDGAHDQMDTRTERNWRLQVLVYYWSDRLILKPRHPFSHPPFPPLIAFWNCSIVECSIVVYESPRSFAGSPAFSHSRLLYESARGQHEKRRSHRSAKEVFF